MPLSSNDSHSPDSDFRFVVLGHPEAGEFLDWDTAVAKAWELTPPGEKRVEVTLSQKGQVRVRTEDPDEDEDLDGIVIKGDAAHLIHRVNEFRSESPESYVVATCCDQEFPGDQWSVYNSATASEAHSPCWQCFPGQAPTDVSAHGAKVTVKQSGGHPLVHQVERAHLRYVQLRCGLIYRRGTLELATHGAKVICSGCFNPDLKPPPRPDLWK